MANYVTTKYGTKINVTGLNPDQVKRVLSVAQDNGAYGGKGAALADTFRKKNATTTTQPTNNAPGGSGGSSTGGSDGGTGGNGATGAGGDPTVDLGINKKTGAIDPKTAVDAVTDATTGDTTKNFNMNNPGTQTDALGNTQKISVDPTTGQTSITQTAGGGLSAVNQAFTNAALDFGQNGQSAATAAANANYNYITRNYGEQKKQEMEAAKQDLAERGIPIDPSEGSLWANTMKAIDDKYQSLDDQANNQALTTANQTLATQAGVVNTLGATVSGQNPTFTAFQGGSSNVAANLQTLLNTISDADLQKYGIDKDLYAKLKAIAASHSGSSSSSSDTGPLIGGNAPGFGVG